MTSKAPKNVQAPIDGRLMPSEARTGREAGDRAFRRFCTPSLSERRAPDHEILVARARPFLARARWEKVASVEGPIDAYVYEPEGSPRGRVLIAHGWTSEASFMTLFAEHFRREGYAVVMFDSPAHGRNPRRQASIIDCARALRAVARALGPFEAVLGHSMGAVQALLAGEGAAPLAPGFSFRRYVLIAAPNRFAEITESFGAGLGLAPDAQRAFERHLERIAHRPLSTFTGASMLARIGAPARIIHARDDTEVGFHNAREIVAACPHAELLAFDTGGHRKILSAPAVIRAALAFIKAS